MRLILNNTRKGEDYREVKSLKEAVKVLRDYVYKLLLRSSEMDFGFGDVYIDGNLKDQISYNGSVITEKGQI